MSGHNKWSKIKHKKAGTDAAKSKIFSKMAKLISTASKQAGGDVTSPVLRTVIEKAREYNMPADNIERAVKKGVAIYMTVQTLWGYVHMFVYDTGRDLMAKGIIPLQNMLPEVAYIKLGWALGQTDDLARVKEIMLTPIAGEITDREPYNGYLVFQGGVPEVEEIKIKA